MRNDWCLCSGVILWYAAYVGKLQIIFLRKRKAAEGFAMSITYKLRDGKGLLFLLQAGRTVNVVKYRAVNCGIYEKWKLQKTSASKREFWGNLCYRDVCAFSVWTIVMLYDSFNLIINTDTPRMFGLSTKALSSCSICEFSFIPSVSTRLLINK